MKITYFDKAGVRDALMQYVTALVIRHPEILRVILFGSVARGDAVPGSDVDLLIVLSKADEPFMERASKFVPRKFPVGIDIFAYTRQELADMLSDNNWFVRRAIKEGEVLFDAERAA